MGSFQQISLGIICLVAAFMFGNYVNNHPDPATVTTAFSQTDSQSAESASVLLEPGQAIVRAAPMEAMRDNSATKLPTMKLPNLFGSKTQEPGALPPPSQLDQPETAKSPTTPVRIPNLLDANKRREIVVPDFSQLATEFRNTPLELPPMQTIRTPNRGGQSAQRHSTQRHSTTPQLDRSGQRSQYTDQQFNPANQIDSTPPQFSAEDFAPKLKERFSPDSVPQVQADRNLNEVALAVPPPAVSLENAQPDSSAPAMIAPQTNSVRPIGADPLLTETGSGQLPPERMQILPPEVIPPAAGVAARDKNWTAIQRPKSINTSARQNHQSAKPLIPFGLTAEAKNKMVRLQRPGDMKISVGTSRFTEHVSRPGDSLQKLSTKYYGRPDFYLDIYLANKHQLRNPASLPPGVALKIPIFD